MFIKKEEYLNLQHRISELEERLCSCHSHEWVKIGVNYIYDQGGGTHTYNYQCKKCGKKTVSLI